MAAGRPRGDLSPVVAAEIEPSHLPRHAARLRAGSRWQAGAGTGGRRVEARDAVRMELRSQRAFRHAVAGRRVRDLRDRQGIFAVEAGASPDRRRCREDDGFRRPRAAGPGRLHRRRCTHDTTPGCAIGITAGQRQLVEFLGRNTFFTELDRKGRLQASMAPGGYSFIVSSGGGFLGPNQAVTLDVRPGQTAASKVALTRFFDPPASGWYSADLHHHADQAEGVTPPEYLARSQSPPGSTCCSSATMIPPRTTHRCGKLPTRAACRSFPRSSCRRRGDTSMRGR